MFDFASYIARHGHNQTTRLSRGGLRASIKGVFPDTLTAEGLESAARRGIGAITINATVKEGTGEYTKTGKERMASVGAGSVQMTGEHTANLFRALRTGENPEASKPRASKSKSKSASAESAAAQLESRANVIPEGSANDAPVSV